MRHPQGQVHEATDSRNTSYVAHPRPNRWLVLFGSTVAMLPWPLLAIGLCLMWSLFNQASEAMLLFGGVTMLCLLPLGMMDTPQWVFAAFIGILSVLVLILPAMFAARLRQRNRLAMSYALQAIFSLVQAGLGLMMILGKEV